MGAIISRFWFILFPAKEYKIVVVGLDNAGKTTTLYKLHLGEVVTTHPIIGSNVEELVYKNIQFEVAGGIWADTIGGKLVMGFGLVWWSIAITLTPITAKLGLPFLLVVRAFMGIDEGVVMPAMNNIL